MIVMTTMKITESKLRRTIRKVIKESRYVQHIERAKQYIGSDQGLYEWLRQNRRAGFTIDMYAPSPVNTPEHVMNLIDSESKLQNLKVIGTISNTIPGSATYLFRDASFNYVVVQVDYKTGRGDIAQGFGSDEATLAQVVNHITQRKPNPEFDKYVSAF